MDFSLDFFGRETHLTVSGQLEAEIKDNAWLTQPVIEDNIFRLPVEVRWEEALRKMGINPALLSDTAGHA